MGEGCAESSGHSFDASKDCEVSPGRRKEESLSLRILNQKPILIADNNFAPSDLFQSLSNPSLARRIEFLT